MYLKELNKFIYPDISNIIMEYCNYIDEIINFNNILPQDLPLYILCKNRSGNTLIHYLIDKIKFNDILNITNFYHYDIMRIFQNKNIYGKTEISRLLHTIHEKSATYIIDSISDPKNTYL